MRQSTTNIASAQKNILAYAQHFLSVNIKATKSVITGSLVNGVLPAGTLIAADGSVAVTTGNADITLATTNAHGVLLEDVDFNNSNGTEILPVVIHGFIKDADVAFSTATNGEAREKLALNMIKFV